MLLPSSPLPERFVERLAEIVPADRFTRCLDSFSRARATTFRVNTLKARTPEVVEELKRKGIHLNRVGWYADAFWIAPRDREALLASAAYKDGRVYVQNLSSMVPPLVLAPEPGERVLDLTAAPGSKTVQMAALMQNRGEIAAVELVRARFFKLLHNVKLQGASIVRTFNKNGEFVWKNCPEQFDRVLLDTPCSTEGRFCTTDPESYAYWSEQKIREMTRKQGRLLFSAIQSLRPGGTLVYSTCSFAPEENEAIVDAQLRRFGDRLETLPIDLDLPDSQPPLRAWRGETFDPRVARARRILPNPQMEGFFVCKLRKTASTLGGG